MFSYNLDHLKELESESIFVLREVAAQFEKPVLLFSGGKDSIVVSHLAQRAFYPAKIPFTLLHIDTGHNFPETIEFRDDWVNKLGARLIVRSVQTSIDSGRAHEETGPYASRNLLQTITLLDAIEELKFDAAIGGARRDEEKARAKERVFSVRDEFGQWDPKKQRPELWGIYNGRIHQGENVRVFPISNWTELDVWNYIKRENIELPSIYFSHTRKCIVRSGGLLALTDFVFTDTEDVIENRKVRFRTVGDATCTAAVESEANTLNDIIREITDTKISERGATRLDDQTSDAAMEDRKKGGYF